MTDNEKDTIVVKKEGVSKEELATALDAVTKKIEELVTPKEVTVSKPETIVTEPVVEDYREKMLENLSKFPHLGDGGADINWKYEGETALDQDATPVEELKKAVGEVNVGNEKRKELGMKEAIGGVTATNAVPEIWASEISRGCMYPKSAFWDAPFVDWKNELKGKPGDTVNIITVGATACVDLACEEPTSTAASVGKTPCVLVEKGCPYYVCKQQLNMFRLVAQDLEDAVPDLIDALAEKAGACLAQCIDNYFLGQAMVTNSGTYAAGTCLTPSHIACVMGSMRAGNQCKRENNPLVC